MSELTPAQADALAQLQAITDSSGNDVDRERAILDSVGWDVQRAVQAIFDDPSTNQGPSRSGPPPPATNGNTVTPPKPATGRDIEQMEIEEDDSNDQHQPLIPSQRGPPHQGGLSILGIITWPFSLSISLISNMFQFVFHILRIPIPRFAMGGLGLRAVPPRTPGGIRRPTRTLDPVTAAERWVRELEDETGAVSITKAAAVGAEEQNGATSSARSTAVETSSAAKPDYRPRNESSEGAGRVLPDFYIGSYENALKLARDDARVLCVILVSEENDDVPEFKRSVLTDPDFVRVMADNDFIVWGGDVRDTGAYQAALKLNVTAYPFVAFLSLHPRHGPRGAPATSSQHPQLTVLARYEGPPSTSTSAQTLHNYVTNTLLPRVTPLLTRVRNEKRTQQLQREREQRSREVERQLRAEQDRAFKEAERIDRAKIEKRIREEKEKELETQRLKAEEEHLKLQAKKKEDWRKWAKANLIPPEPPIGSKGALRIGIRLPDGKRLIRQFAPEDSLMALYTFVDVHFMKSIDGPVPANPPTDYQHTFGFGLATSYPRKEIPWEEGVKLGNVSEVSRGGNLVVEMKAGFSEDVEEEEEDESSEEDE